MVKPKNRPDPARPGHVKIAIDITAVDIDLFLSVQYRYIIMILSEKYDTNVVPRLKKNWHPSNPGVMI